MAPLFARTAKWSATHPVLAIALVLILTAGLGAGMTQTDAGRVSELFVPDNLEAGKTLDQIEKIWGESDGSFFLYIVDDPTHPEILRAVSRDAHRLMAEEKVIDVAGLPLVLEARLGDLQDVSDGDLRAAAKQLMGTAVGSSMATEDALLVRISTERDPDIAATTAMLDSVAQQSNAPGELLVTGTLHLEEAERASGDADVGFLMPLSVATLILVLALLFRRVKDVAAPLAASLLAIVMAYGTVAWVGLPLAPPSFITMPLLLGLGVDYMLHIIYAYREQPVAWDIPRRFEGAGRAVGLPVFFTALTTLIGFGSFLASNIPQIRVWGLLIGSGAIYAFILGFVALPAFYRIGRRHTGKARPLPLGGLLDKWSNVVVKRRVIVLAAVAIVTVGLGAAATQLDVEAELAFELDESIPAIAALQQIEQRFGGQTTAQILLPSGDRALLKGIEAELNTISSIGFVDGPTQRLHQAGDPNGPLVQPATEGVATADWWRIVVGYPDGDDATLDAIRSIAASAPEARLTGQVLIQQESQETVLDSLFLSTGIALALVLTLLVVVFRHLPTALLAFAPLIVTVIWQLGLQSLLGIPLNPITGIITAMTLGIGVDYALHIVSHFRSHRHEGRQAAARKAVASVGRPVLAASLTTVFAFSVLGFSSLLPLQQFGYTAAIVITCAFVASLTFLPAIASIGGTKAKAVGEPRVIFQERQAVLFEGHAPDHVVAGKS